MAGARGWPGQPCRCSKFACSLIRVTYIMRPPASTAAARAVGGNNDENVVGRNAGDAAGERSLGRFLPNILRRICWVPLVQHDVSMMRTKLLTGVAVLLLSAGTAHACELETKILKDNSLHILVRCDDVEMFHRDMDFYHPRGGPHDEAHKCRLESVEQIDQVGAIVHTYCEYKKGNKNSALVIQLSGDDILITNTENY